MEEGQEYEANVRIPGYEIKKEISESIEYNIESNNFLHCPYNLLRLPWGGRRGGWQKKQQLERNSERVYLSIGTWRATHEMCCRFVKFTWSHFRLVGINWTCPRLAEL